MEERKRIFGVFACEDCEHYIDGKCEYGFELYEDDDAYDCTRFEDKYPFGS